MVVMWQENRYQIWRSKFVKWRFILFISIGRVAVDWHRSWKEADKVMGGTAILFKLILSL